MLTIRSAQMGMLAAASVRQFEVTAAQHLTNSVPEFCAELGPDALAEFVHAAIQRGMLHGLEDDYDLLCFLNLTYLLDPGFDDDPALPWAKAYLADQEVPPSARLELLYHHAENYLRQLDGEAAVA